VIPNSVLMKNKFLVLGRREGQPEQWRRWVWFNVEYTISPGRVIAIVEEALQQAAIPNVSTQPPPNCVMMELDDSNGRYAVRYWLTDLSVDDPTDSAVRGHIFAALKRAGIDPALPGQLVYLVNEGEEREQQLHAIEIEKRVKGLQGVELFSRFSDAELHRLAEGLVFAPFAKGDVVTRQGAVAHWLYILSRGDADVVLETEGEQRQTIGQIRAGGSGSFFGEMGMLTGEPRTATVVAATDLVCYRLDKSAFEDIIHARPAIAEEIAQIMAQRRLGLESARHDLDEAAHQAEMARHQGEVLAKIREFFRL
jgi:CRP-like cAMP-binding protein